MPRLHFKDLPVGRGGAYEALLHKPDACPEGYTPGILLTEWLTLNCRDDWASHMRARRVIVRFAGADDCVRAVDRFGGEIVSAPAALEPVRRAA